jgi:hypothetical protein
MAFPMEEVPELPEVAAVSEYTVIRLGMNPVVRVRYAECVVEAEPNILGMVQHRPVRGGRRWELVLSSDDDVQRGRIEQMMGAAMFAAVKAGLEALEVEKTDQEIMGAVMALQAEGVNIDSILASQAESLELDRRAGGIPIQPMPQRPSMLL